MRGIDSLLFDLFIRRYGERPGRVFIVGAKEVAQRTAHFLSHTGINVEALVDHEAVETTAGVKVAGIDALDRVLDSDWFVVAEPDASAELQVELHRRSLRADFFAFKGTFEQREFTQKELPRLLRAAELFESDHLSRAVFAAAIEMRLSGTFAAAGSVKSQPQYFDQAIFSFGEREVMVDGGAFIGDTLEQLQAVTRGRYSKCYSFEPDARNFEILQSAAAKLPGQERIEMLPLGLYDKAGDICFHQSVVRGHGSSRIRPDGGFNIQTVSLDEFLNGRPATFIKLDIEGAEPEALIGARQTMITHRPKLAICVYHRFAHLWDVPLFISETLPNYDFFLRHHSSNAWETVFYARPR